MSLKNIPSIPVDEIIPQGSNQLKSKDKFIQNIEYERYFLNFITKNNLSNNSFFDTRINDKEYGKIDFDNNIVTVDPLQMKDINGDLNTLALPFVSDAFRNLKIICSAYKKNQTFKNNFFGSIVAKSGFVNVNNLYHEYMNSIYTIFLSYIQEKNKNIYNFNDFFKYFIMFLKEVCDKSPFLKSSYINSNICGVNTTGLCLEIDNSPKDKDFYKYSKYFNDSDFVEFQKICEAHSFKIDKYCPWRLIFDINGVNAQKYLSNYNLNKNNLFNNMFLKTIDYDLDIILSYLAIFYNSFIKNNSFIEKTKIKKTVNDSIFIEKTLFDRQNTLVDLQIIKDTYSKNFLYKFYFYILFLENKIDLNQVEYEKNVNLLSIKAINYGLKASFEEFDKLLLNYKLTNTKKFIFTFEDS